MRTLLNRPRRVLQIAAAIIPLVIYASSAHADIFQWEYANPADLSQGKRQSTTLVPDGAGVDAVPGAILLGRDLSKAFFINADLSNADLGSRTTSISSTLTDLGQFFHSVWLRETNLAAADFTGANVRGASFSRLFFAPGTGRQHHTSGAGVTLEQLYSTASYQAGDLFGIDLTSNALEGGNFAGQNLVNARLTGASLEGADFTEAWITAADFSCHIHSGGGLSLEQLYSTADYQAGSLAGLGLAGNDLSGGSFAGLDLTNVRFDGAKLTDTDLAGAIVLGADFTIRRYTFYVPRQSFVIEGTGLTAAQLYSTASYQARDLRGIRLTGNNLEGVDFAGQNLTNANFNRATLTSADFSGSVIRGTIFDPSYWYPTGTEITGTGITLSQLYSTASYQTKDLSGVILAYNDLAGGSFAGQNLVNASFSNTTLPDADFTAANLTNAYFWSATLSGSDFTAADARGAFGLNVSGVKATNLIQPDGHIDGLDLDAGGLLVVRDYDGNPAAQNVGPIPITVDQHLTMSPGGALRMVFEADAWDSTMSFAPGIPVTLGGTLELEFTTDGNPANQIGRTFKLFDWTGVNPAGAFAISSPYAWDLSNLSTTGEVTLTVVPEPRGVLLLNFALGALVAMVRVRLSFN